jgi:hypothetical protein
LKTAAIAKLSGYCFLIFCLLFLNSCKSYQQMAVPKTPKPQIIAKGKKPKIMPASYLKLQMEKQLPELKELIINDQHYVYITKEWFLQMNEWTVSFINQQAPDLQKSGNLPVDYEQTYTMFLNSIANLQIAKHYNIKSSALIGILVAKNVQPWGEIPATGENMSYVIVLSEKAMMVYDITTKQLCKIYAFPNLKHTQGVIF